MKQSLAEEITKVVYGETFGRYSKEEFLQFLEPLKLRLQENGIPTSVFQDKTCLDAGCGGGRGTVLMATSGANRVTAFDLSEQNTRTTKRHAGLFDLQNVKTQFGNLLALPYEDESFDVVWCNGVLHHTVDPDLALREVTRVLKVGGHLWLYLYGSGGLYWFMVDFIRDWLSEVPIAETIAQLAVHGTTTGHIAEFIDDWYVPMLKRYTHQDVAKRLEELGFSTIELLKGGMTYDTSVRSTVREEQPWMGQGDLRYWLTKQAHATSEGTHFLPDMDGKGSAYQDSPQVAAFAEVFQQVAGTVDSLERLFPSLRNSARIVLSARIHQHLRDCLSQSGSFDGQLFRDWIVKQVEHLNKFIVSGA